MALDFPSSPTTGQLYPSPAVAGAPVWKWDGSEWVLNTGNGATAFSQFEYTATAGQTSFSGADANGATLAYTVGFIEVFVNGYKLNKGDFTATNGTTVVLGSAVGAGDLVTVLAFSSISIANALSPGNNLSDVGSVVTARQNLGAGINELQNISFAVSAASGALTIALKDANGNDPTNTLLSFRNASPSASPNVPTILQIASATSITIPSTSTCGFASATAGRLWITGWNDGGTFRLGVFNASASGTIYPLPETGVASSLQAVAAGNSAGQHYTAGAAVTNKTYRILGYVDWNSSGMTAGTWTTTNLNSIVTFGPGVKKPGDLIQTVFTQFGTVATGSTTFPLTNAAITNSSGDQYMSQAITPTNAANRLRVETSAFVTNSAASEWMGMGLFQDAVSAVLAVNWHHIAVATAGASVHILYDALASTVSATTFKVRIGGSAAGTTTFNGSTTQFGNGLLNSFMKIQELQG